MIRDDTIPRTRLVTVLLVGGPCAGQYAQVVGWGDEAWQRVGRPGRPGVETQMWARYDHDPQKRGEYVYSGVTITTQQLGEALTRMKRAGHTYGQTEGA